MRTKKREWIKSEKGEGAMVRWQKEGMLGGVLG